jgi:predicted phosphoribosyltransferase
VAFRDRADGGRALAAALDDLRDRDDVVVLGLPRGGVPVAAEVAQALGAPLDVFVVRKLGVPGHRELAMGAIASGGVRVLNDWVVAQSGVSARDLERVTEAETAELVRRETAYRGNRAPVAVAGRIVVLVDDGLATGATMRAAVAAVRALGPSSVVVAVPVGAPEAVEVVSAAADRMVCVEAPPWFLAVGRHYDDFTETTDEEVRRLLAS